MVKTAIVALSAAALLAFAPPALARVASSKTPGVQHHVAKRHHAGAHDVRRHVMQARGAGYPGAFGYAPAAPSVSDQDFIRSRQFGGGGGGGSM
jgi:hypothetical protein